MAAYKAKLLKFIQSPPTLLLLFPSLNQSPPTLLLPFSLFLSIFTHLAPPLLPLLINLHPPCSSPSPSSYQSSPTLLLPLPLSLSSFAHLAPPLPLTQSISICLAPPSLSYVLINLHPSWSYPLPLLINLYPPCSSPFPSHYQCPQCTHLAPPLPLF